MASEDAIWELKVKTTGEEDLKKLEHDLLDVGEAAKKIEGSGEKAAKSTKNMGQAGLEASRAIEDLQYGLAGVLNNLPGLVIGLGGTAGLAGAISLVAIGVNQLVKHWDEIAGLFETRNPFPKAANDIAGMRKELDGAKKSMEDMEKAGSGNAQQIEKYNQLRKTTAELEERIAKAEKEQQEIAALRKLEEPGAVEAKKERADIVQAAVGGKQKAIEGALATQLSEQDRAKMFSDRRILHGQIATTAPGANRNDLLRQLSALNTRIAQSGRGELFGEHQAQAEKMVAGAATGDQGAINRMNAMMRGNARFDVGGPLEWVRAQTEGATPQGARARREAAGAIEEQVKQAADDKKQAADRKKRLSELQNAIVDFEKDSDAGTRRVEAAKKKAIEAELKRAEKELEEEAKEAEKRHEAAAKRIHAAAGEEAGKTLWWHRRGGRSRG